MQAPSLAYALNQQAKIVCSGCHGEATPHSQVATPSRNAISPYGNGLTPVVSPAHHDNGFGFQAAKVSVIAPGGGTGINSAVYEKLDQDPQFAVDIVGRSRAPYDVYPEYWPNGAPAPNLETFADDVLRHHWVERSDCFVFGSRGGQVVLPYLWRHKGDLMPPVVCLNGGCAMSLPQRVHWPISAVTFLLLGGDDYFRGNSTVDEYVAEAKAQVPQTNSTTAVLYVNEMGHMPQQALLNAVLPLMLRAVLTWDSTRRPPKDVLRLILSAVNRDGWSGRLMFTQGPGNWAPEVDFGPFTVSRRSAAENLQPSAPISHAPIEVSRRDELKALFRAAASAAKPGGGVPLAPSGSRFHAAVQAASASKAQQATQQSNYPSTTASSITSPTKKKQLSLPIASAGTHGRSSSPGGWSGTSGMSPYGGRTPKTPNRLGIPSGRSPCAPTPISRALGMEMRYASPARSSHSPHSFADGSSPAGHPSMVVVRN